MGHNSGAGAGAALLPGIVVISTSHLQPHWGYMAFRGGITHSHLQMGKLRWCECYAGG